MGRRARLDRRIEEELKKAFNTTYHHASFLSGGDHLCARRQQETLKNHETFLA